MTEFLTAYSPELFAVFVILFACVMAFPAISFVLRNWRGK
jgi:hypothetical protein